LFTSITVKIIFGLIALMIVIRLMGKRQLSEITPFDFIYVLVLGGLLEETVYDDSVPVWEVFYTIALWSGLVYLIERVVRKFEWLRPVIKGEPSIVVRDGKLNVKEISKNKLESEQIRTMLRQQGIFSITEVKYAILEPSGQLSVMKTESSSEVTAEMLDLQPRKTSLSYLLVDEGQIEWKQLDAIGKDENWLRELLKKQGYEKIGNIYYAEWSEEHGLIVTLYDEPNFKHSPIS
jgi:uncharacterized membrane protein YcaP (DUF421 family)